jgi:simple sugar transport system ATP-binding protein
MYFGASVLILDEPTSALGVRQASLVLQLVERARDDGLAIIFISHNVIHAMKVGDRFKVLRHGRSYADAVRGEITRDELLEYMSGDDQVPDEKDLEPADVRLKADENRETGDAVLDDPPLSHP